jgi:hypothetical protein
VELIPRIIEVFYSFEPPFELSHYTFCCLSPTLLQVCRESREIALQKYQPAFSCSTKPEQRPVLVNFDLDTFYLSSEKSRNLDDFIEFFYDDTPNDLDRIKKLAVNSFFWDCHATYSIEQGDGFVMGILLEFDSLTEFTIVMESGSECGYGLGPWFKGDTKPIEFVTPAADISVVRGWRCSPATLAGVVDLVKQGLQFQNEWNLEDGKQNEKTGKGSLAIRAACREPLLQ